MDIKRASNIASSSIMANVTHNGTQIYIENVNEDKGTVNIHPINEPNRKQEVPLASLKISQPSLLLFSVPYLSP